MRLELTRVGLLVELANDYTTRGGLNIYGWVLWHINPCGLFNAKLSL